MEKSKKLPVWNNPYRLMVGDTLIFTKKKKRLYLRIVELYKVNDRELFDIKFKKRNNHVVRYSAVYIDRCIQDGIVLMEKSGFS